VARQDASDATFWQDAVRGQVFLGDEAFAARMQALAEPQRLANAETPKPQRRRRVPLDWSACLAHCDGDRNRALVMGYRDGGTTMTLLAAHAGLSLSMVSRVIKSATQGAHGGGLGEGHARFKT